MQRLQSLVAEARKQALYIKTDHGTTLQSSLPTLQPKVGTLHTLPPAPPHSTPSVCSRHMGLKHVPAFRKACRKRRGKRESQNLEKFVLWLSYSEKGEQWFFTDTNEIPEAELVKKGSWQLLVKNQLVLVQDMGSISSTYMVAHNHP